MYSLQRASARLTRLRFGRTVCPSPDGRMVLHGLMFAACLPGGPRCSSVASAAEGFRPTH
jgi:hypothetical protein